MMDGKKLMEARLKAGLSRPELSRKTGIPVRNIENWELGRTNKRRIAMLHTLADAIGCRPGELYADDVIVDVVGVLSLIIKKL